jgi:effector-binding domain-containing protein
LLPGWILCYTFPIGTYRRFSVPIKQTDRSNEDDLVAYQIHIKRVESSLTAVVRCRARPDELSKIVPQGCGEVWTFVRSAGLPHPGRNLAIYLDDIIHLECGVEVTAAFTGTGHVVCSTTPAGMVATTTHVGPYNRLGEAHEAIGRFCKENGHALTGLNWEVYGHWNDDPAKLETDVFYLLQDGESSS